MKIKAPQFDIFFSGSDQLDCQPRPESTESAWHQTQGNPGSQPGSQPALAWHTPGAAKLQVII